MIDLGLDRALKVRFQSNIFLSKLLQVVEVYIKTEDEVNSIQENNLFSDIGNLINSRNIDLRMQATDLMKTLCFNLSIFEYIVKIGIIENLEKIEKSSHMR